MRQLNELCDLVGGKLLGPREIEISGAASISRAEPGDITFVTNSKYVDAFENSAAVAAVAAPGLNANKPLIVVEQPEASFAKIVQQFRPQHQRQRIGISQAAFVSESARISDDVDIFPGAFIGENVEIGFGSQIHANVSIMDGCKIGAGVQIFPSAVLYPGTEIGDRVIIHGGAVLGAHGFGYKSSSGRHILSPQLGNVIIEDDVEVGANTTIDRGTFDPTIIGQGTKLDDQVMIGHNCRIGKHNLFCSQVGIAGSCTTGDYVVMGGQVGIGDHIEIGSGARLAAKTGVMQNIPENAAMAGIPSVPMRQFLKQAALVAKLGDMRKQIKLLAKQLPTANSTSKSDEHPSQDAA